jgi:PIN like domain
VRQRFGTRHDVPFLMTVEATKPPGPAEVLESVFRRDSPISALAHLRDGLVPVPADQFAFRDAIICIDTAGLINLSKHKSVATVLDYFQSRHPIKLMVSAQTVLEFWNSHISAFETISASLTKRIADLEREIEKIDGSMGIFRDEFKGLVARFNEEYGHLHDANSRAKLTALATQLPECAEVFEAPRIRFALYAAYRKATKTPPGFKDTGDGDFFVWVDNLFGLLTVKSRGAAFRSAVMVTDDKKSDWSKGGVAHPLLVAEVRSCVDVPFACWGVERLVAAVQSEVNGVPEASNEADPAEVT